MRLPACRKSETSAKRKLAQPPETQGATRLEAEVGIEPTDDGFANHCLTTWLLRRAHGAVAIW